MGVIFDGVGLFPQLFVFVLAAPVQQCTRHYGQSDSQPVGGKGPPKNDPTMTKTQLQPESPHK